IFLINSSYHLWIPIYIFNGGEFKSPVMITLIIAEFLLSLFCVFYSIKLNAGSTTKAFHTNMNSLYAYFVFSWMFSGVGNSLTTPYLTGTWKVDDNSTNYRSWWTDDMAEMTPIKSVQEAWPLFLGGFLTWYYMFVMTTCLFIMSLERICASYFIGNYENTSRLYLFFLLFLFQQFIILTTIYLVFYNRVHFIPVVSFLLQYNLKIIRKFKKKPAQQSGRFHTLPVRFQAKENLRVFNLTVRVFVCGFVMIMSALILVIVITFKCVSSWDTFLTYCFNNIVHL
ncbi:Protein CBG20944, partial [Caenorhabditis briggsae]